MDDDHLVVECCRLGEEQNDNHVVRKRSILDLGVDVASTGWQDVAGTVVDRANSSVVSAAGCCFDPAAE